MSCGEFYLQDINSIRSFDIGLSFDVRVNIGEMIIINAAAGCRETHVVLHNTKSHHVNNFSISFLFQIAI